MGPLTAICRYPVKGLPPEDVGQLRLYADAAMPGDRGLALTHAASAFDPANPAWVPRGNFVVVARSPGLAALRLAAEEGGIALTAPDGDRLVADLTSDSDRAALCDWIAAHADQPGPFALVQVPRQALHDTPLPAVSVMSEASLAALSDRAGRPLGKERFRGNLWIAGGAPFAETALVGHRFSIGDVTLEGLEPIARCRAVDASPDTGTYDSDLCRDLHALTGAADFGILARVVSSGTVAVGDQVAAV
ncbi:MOSC domain-containing protein [Anianabacter salinae]|uniref:MOSC domain-containing protein n=1 Tax=Anianabacter salinae TaxID=2851023 RepID=UPI00225E1450|nr:MOSC domain-containing protein [Anianabacter salinae]MBV0911457.1 MOSC domain-containing protein [Anianabacter salinae]